MNGVTYCCDYCEYKATQKSSVATHIQKKHNVIISLLYIIYPSTWSQSMKELYVLVTCVNVEQLISQV